MSGRFVRASKYRHVHGEPNKRAYQNVATVPVGDGDQLKANNRFIVYPTAGGGSPLVILRREDLGIKVPPGYPTLNVHKIKVVDFEFSPHNDHLLATGAEDNFIKISIIPEGGLTATVEEAAATLEGHRKKVNWLKFHPTASNILASASYDFSVKIWDIARGANVHSYEDIGETMLSFSWSYDGKQIFGHSKDKKVRLYDPRVQGAVAVTEGLPGAKAPRVFCADNRNIFGAVGFGGAGNVRSVLCFDPRNFGRPVLSHDLDNSAGAIIPHYDYDTGVLFLAGKGDGNIRYFEFSDEPALCSLSEYRTNESQKGVTFLPKLACDVGSCEIALALRLLSSSIQPVSFQVPRKSDLFQEDIFPDTLSNVPSMTSDEWLAGENKPGHLVSMNPANRPAAASSGAAQPVFKAARSAAELERELAAAHERIAKLEAELAALRPS